MAFDGTIVIVFADLGLTFNFICLFAYGFYAKKDAALEYKEMKRELKQNGDSVNDSLHKKTKKPHINMFSVLIYISTDLFCFASTFILGVLMVSDTLVNDQVDRGDRILAVIISGTIYVAAAITLIEWFKSLGAWYGGMGQAIEVVCPHGIKPENTILIDPNKAGQVAIVDMTSSNKDMSYTMLKETPYVVRRICS
jgi:hypothetical protein